MAKYVNRDPDSLTTGQAARLLGLSQNTVIRCCDAGQLPHHKIPPLFKLRLIRRADLLAYAKSHNLPLKEEPADG